MSECGVPAAAPSWAPKWVFCPREKILSVVVEWIVAGFEAIALALAGAVGEFYGALGLAGQAAGDAITWSLGNVGDALLTGVAFNINNAIMGIATSAGPAAPFVVVLLYLLISAALVGLFVVLRKVVLWLT